MASESVLLLDLETEVGGNLNSEVDMKVTLRGLIVWVLTAMFMVGGGTVALAGPFILSGTDSDDHGGTSGGANQGGWLFMQQALENIAPAVTNGNNVVTILGSSGSALTAAESAVTLSNLGSPGWTLETVSTANLGTFFGTGGGLADSGILMMDSGSNVFGGVDGTQFSPYASTIDTFIGNGGGLFSQGNGYAWVTDLLPALTVTDLGGGGVGSSLSLTAAGNAAFPGLTNPDLSTGPWHNYFTGTGALPILATAADFVGVTRNVILGSGTGSITNPGNPGNPGVGAPEPSILLLLGSGLVGLVAWRWNRAA